jgi:hypothetical protein
MLYPIDFHRRVDRRWAERTSSATARSLAQRTTEHARKHIDALSGQATEFSRPRPSAAARTAEPLDPA